MKLEQIRGLATEELEKSEIECRDELFRLRYSLDTESVENTSKIRELKRRIARIKTILRERELAAAAQPAAAGEES